MESEESERLARFILVGAIAFSFILHGIFALGLVLLPAVSAISELASEEIAIEIVPEVTPEPEPEPEAPEPESEETELPEPEPEIEPPPRRPPPPRPVRAPPDAPAAAPDEAPSDPAPAAEQALDMDGLVLTGQGGDFAVATGTGRDTSGPIGNAVATTTGRDVTGSGTGAVGGTGTSEARRVDYSQSARPPGNMNSLLQRYYPRGAQSRGVEGRSVARFRVRADGTVQVVGIASETPAGEGFGRACRSALERARFSPALDTSGRAVPFGPRSYTCVFRVR